MYFVYFFDVTTNKMKVLDFGTSLEDSQKKLIYYGKEFIENENGKKHLEVCVKDVNIDLNNEVDGYYLIKNLEKVELVKKSTKIDDVKGWTGTYQSVKSEISNLGYYSFVEFDGKLLKQYSYDSFNIESNKKQIQIKQTAKYEQSNNLVNALKESGFKPNKDCRFKFNIVRKEHEIQTSEDPINIPTLVGQITNNKVETYSEDEYSDNNGEDDIACVRSIIDDNFNESIDSSIEDCSFSDERYDLLANIDKLDSILKIDKFYENSDLDYLDSEEDIDYDNSKETLLQTQLKEESLLYEPISKIEKKSIGTNCKVTFVKKAWKCD